jgi:site-specific DNA-methyltransferase (adenine-specific)
MKKIFETNKIIFGDCLQLMPELIPDSSIDLIFTDLPYDFTNCRWDNLIPLDKLWIQYERIIKEHGAIVLTSAQPFTTILASSNLKLFRYEWIWIKSKGSGFMNSKKMPMRYHENILVFYKKLPTYNPQGLIKGSFKNTRANFKKDNIYSDSGVQKKPKRFVSEYTNYPKDFIIIENPSNKGHMHPTQKPLALCDYFINTYSNEGMIILDNAAGSGSTGLSAKNLNRKCILMDNDLKYCNLMAERLPDFEKLNF